MAPFDKPSASKKRCCRNHFPQSKADRRAMGPGYPKRWYTVTSSTQTISLSIIFKVTGNEMSLGKSTSDLAQSSRHLPPQRLGPLRRFLMGQSHSSDGYLPGQA